MDDKVQPVVATNVPGAANRNADEEVVELELHSGCSDWAVAQYKALYADSLDARRFSAMLSDGYTRTMFDQRGVWRDTKMSAWERRRTLLRLCYPGYINPASPFDMPLVRNDDEVEYVCNLRRWIARSEYFRHTGGFDFVCLRQPYD